MDNNQQQTDATLVRVEANDCLIRDSQKIAGLQHTEKFTRGLDSVVETLLPFHVLHRKSVLDEDYDCAQGLGGRQGDGTSGFRRMLGCRNEIWEARMLKKASRVRRRLAKLARRVKDLEGLELGRGSDICELVLHVGDASVQEYRLQCKQDEELKKRAEEEKERRLAERRALEERMAKEEAARKQREIELKQRHEAQLEQLAKQEQETKSGTLKLKLSRPSSSKMQNPSSLSVPAMSEDIMTDAIGDTHGVSDSRAMSTEIGDEVSHQIKDSVAGTSSSSSSSGDEEEKVDKPQQQQVKLGASQAGKFKLYAMLQKKKQGQ